METTASPPETTPARRRVPVRTRLDFWFDAVLLVAYTLAYSLGFTGLAIHEWLGLGIGLALLLHLTLHWDWVVRTTVKLFARGGRDRGIWLLNLALLVVMTLCVLSGVLISRIALYQLGITVSGGPFWNNVHDTTSKLTLILASVHVAVRWRWIVSVARRLLGSRRPDGSRRSRPPDGSRRSRPPDGPPRSRPPDGPPRSRPPDGPPRSRPPDGSRRSR